MIVCLCHRISDRDIARHAAAGSKSFEAMQEELRVGTACGACIDCAQQTWAEHTGGAASCEGCPGQVHCGHRSITLAVA
jgi:bacterioferritin-associated ferredoxin